ncbi:hypothetical protein SKAU_G00199520 [Synaphobranchus kaupii]|uniref:Uncharacterized protein n=1 Tax=Synaphobranchus kaupii TaxID=118154 RepID=A0A9Q1IY22_SYNKA|nr:hypothetical protein SKAU_G00199520 [Synaphobranchus kaupii]
MGIAEMLTGIEASLDTSMILGTGAVYRQERKNSSCYVGNGRGKKPRRACPLVPYTPPHPHIYFFLFTCRDRRDETQQAPEVLDDPVDDSGCSEERDLGPEELPDAVEWSDLAQEQAQDTTEEFFDTHSWHSDALSDIAPDGEECPAALLTAGGPCEGQSHPTGCLLHATEGSSMGILSEMCQEAPDWLQRPPEHDPSLDLCSVGLDSCTVHRRCVSGSPERTEPFWSEEVPNRGCLQSTSKEAGLPVPSVLSASEMVVPSPKKKVTNGADLQMKKCSIRLAYAPGNTQK